MKNYVVHFLSLLYFVPSCHPSSNYVQLLAALKHIAASVPSSRSYCSQLNILRESNMLPHIHTELSAQGLDPEKPQVTLVVDLSLNANNEDPPKLFYSENRYFYRHHQPCTVVYFELISDLLDHVELLNNGTIGRRWAEKILPLLSNDVYRSFFIFFLPHFHKDSSSSLSTKAYNFMHETGTIQYSTFVIPDSVVEISIFKGLPKASQELRLVATLRNEIWETFPPELELFADDFDFQGQELITLFCVVCAPTQEEVKSRNVVGNPFKLAWLLAYEIFNMTPVIEKVFGVPDKGLMEDGEFGDMVFPTIDGSAVATGIMIPSIHTDHLVMFTRPYYYDSVSFITGPPGVSNSGGIYMIEEPLDWPVWIAVIASSFCIFVCLEVFFYFANGRRLISLERHAWILEMVYKPMLDQSGFDPVLFRSRVRLYRIHFVLGIWSLCLIVLQCAYDSALLGVIAFPRLILPPQNFRELAEASDYEIGGIFTGPITHDLKASNLTSNLIIAERLIEHDFLDSTCYQSIFERKMACVGLRSVFGSIGGKFTMDTNGKIISVYSKDTHFLMYGAAAVSKFYPMLLGSENVNAILINEPINRLLGSFDSFGLSDHGVRVSRIKSRKKGIAYARENVPKKQYYLGFEGRSDLHMSVDHKTIGILLEILQVGLGVSTAVIICEFVIHYSYDRFEKQHIIVSLSNHHRLAYAPQIYVAEFRFRTGATSVAAVRFLNARSSYKNYPH